MVEKRSPEIQAALNRFDEAMQRRIHERLQAEGRDRPGEVSLWDLLGPNWKAEATALGVYIPTVRLLPQPHDLYVLMSDISENYMCAGWLIGLEETLWKILVAWRAGCTDEDITFGFGPISREDLEALDESQRAVGGWVVWDTHPAAKEAGVVPLDDYGVFVPEEVWLRHAPTPTGRVLGPPGHPFLWRHPHRNERR